MAGVYKGLHVKIGADTHDLDSALNKIDANVSKLKKNASAVQKALKLDPRNTTLLKQQMGNYGEQVKQTEARLKELRAAESELGREGLGEEGWNTLQREIAVAEANLKRYRDQLRQARIEHESASSGIGKAGAAVREFGEGISGASQKLKSFGDSYAARVTAPMVAAGAASVKAAVDIDTSLTNVRKTVDGTEEDYRALKEAALGFSRTNAVSASQMLDIEALGAQLGFTLEKFENGKSQVQEFGEVVSGLDIATNMSAEQAGTELAQFFNIMDEAKDHASNYGSAIVDLGNNFATTESSISAMAMRIAGAGKNIGLSSADVLGLAAALTSLGIEAEAGGTAISTVMSEIDKSVALGSEDLETWAATARMSVEEFTAAWSDNPVRALEAVLTGMQAATAEGGNMAVMLDDLGITSIRQTDMMKRLANGGDLMAGAVSRANAAWDENTALSAEVANRNESLAARFDMLKNRVIEVASQVGEPLADALMDAVEAGQPLIDMASDAARAFSEMDVEQQRAVMGALGMVAALGPMLSIAGRLGASVETVGSAMEGLSRFMATVKLASNDAAEALDLVRGGAGTLGEGMELAAEGSGRLGGALTLLGRFTPAALGITAIAGAIAIQAQHEADAAERAETLAKATDGLRGALESGFTAADKTADAIGQVGEEAQASAPDVYALRDATREMAESQAGWAQSIADRKASVESDMGMMEAYASVIRRLSGNVEEGTPEFEQLKMAVDALNGMLGTNYQVLADQNGALADENGQLLDNISAIDGYVAAKERQLQMSVYEDAYTEAFRRRTEAEQALGEAEQALTSVTDEYHEALDRAGESASSYEDRMSAKSAVEMEYAEKLRIANDAVDQQREMFGAAEDACAQWSEKMAGLTAEESRLASLSDAVGMSAADLEGKMRDAGTAVSAFGDMSAEAFAEMYRECDGDVSAMLARIAELEGRELAPVEVEVTDNGTAQATADDLETVSEAAGGIPESEVIGVSDGGTAQSTSESLGEVAEAAAEIPESEHVRVTDDGTSERVKLGASLLGGALRNLPGTTSTRMTDNGTGAAVRREANSASASVRSFNGKTGTATLRVNNQASGVISGVIGQVASFARTWTASLRTVRSAQGHIFVPKFADGGILTGPTMTPYGLAGEAGTEAMIPGPRGQMGIFPLSNRRYVRPFAQAVAAEMGGGPKTSVTNVNVSLSYEAGADANAMARDIASSLARLVDMEA